MHPFCDFMEEINLMPNSDKPFNSIEQQINKLKNQRGLLFQNEQWASHLLLNYGYYEIINGYKYHFMKDKANDDAGFIEGTTFEHIYQLFNFDRFLRSQVMSALETFELSLRQSIAYTVSECISDKQDEYLSRRRYRTGRRQYIHSAHRELYPIDHLLNILNGITHANSEPFKHYREDHGNVPPWIIVKKLNFGSLIWWFRLLKSNEKNLVVARMLGQDVNLVEQTPMLKSAMSNLLSLYLDYRNTAAHGGRIYNHFSTDHELQYNALLHGILGVTSEDYRQGKGRSHLGVVLKSLQLFDNKDPYSELKIGINVYLKNYLKLYPQDKEYLLNTMELTDNDINLNTVN